MAATGVEGTGFVLTMAGFTHKIIDVDGPNVTVPVIDGNTMSTVGWTDKILGKLKDAGQVNMTIELGSTMPPVGSWLATTMTFAGGLICSGLMAITEWKGGAKIGERETANITLTVTGALTIGG